MGREGHNYKSLQQIFDIFTSKQTARSDAEFTAQTAGAASSSATPMQMIGLGQSYDPLFLAQQKLQLKVGNHYLFEDSLYKVTSLSSEKILLQPAWLFSDGEDVKAIETSNAAKELKVFKGAVPELLDATIALSRHPSSFCSQDMLQTEAWLALLKSAAKLEPKDLWKLVALDPSSKKLYSLQKLKAHQLCLVPVTDAIGKLSLQPPKDDSKHSCMILQQTVFYIMPPKGFKAASASSTCQGSTAPFWYVEKCDDDPILAWRDMTFQQCSIQCLTNPKVIRKHVMLTMPAPCTAQPTIVEPSKKKAKSKK